MITDLTAALDGAGIGLRRYTPGNHRGPCPSCRKGPRDDALGVTIDQDGGAVWHCFRCAWAGAWRPRVPAPERPAARREPKPDPDAAEKQARAVEIWRDADSRIAGTPAEGYLLSRGLEPAKMTTDPPGWPETLRWSEDAIRLPHARHHRMALIVAINDARHHVVCGIHRIFLHRNGTPVLDGNGKKIKRALGPVDGNAAMLSCWPSPDGRWGVAEGVESALAARQLCWIPVWAAIHAGNMQKVVPPPWARHAIVFADHDETGLARAAEAARALRSRPTIDSVRLVRSRAPGGDPADVLKEAVHG